MTFTLYSPSEIFWTSFFPERGETLTYILMRIRRGNFANDFPLFYLQPNSIKHIICQKKNQKSVCPNENFSRESAFEIRPEIKCVDYHKNIENNVQKMNRAPELRGNIFPGIGSHNQQNHEIKNNCSQSGKHWLEA